MKKKGFFEIIKKTNDINIVLQYKSENVFDDKIF